MKWLIATGFIVLSGIALASCNGASNDNEKKANKVNPKSIAGRAPSGIPEDEGSLYEITGLKGLIRYGNSLLVQVSPIRSSDEEIWSRHEDEFHKLVSKIYLDNDRVSIGPKYANLIRLTDVKEKNHSYYYFEEIDNRDQSKSYVLRAYCASAIILHEKGSSCFFGYRTKDEYIEFTLDEQTVEDTRVKSIEDAVLSQLNINKVELRWTTATVR